MRAAALLTLLLAGCGGKPHPALLDRVQGITEAVLKAHVAALAGIGPHPATDEAASKKAVDYLAERLKAFGYEPELEAFEIPPQRFGECSEAGVYFYQDIPGLKGTNKLATLRGTSRPDEIVELGAHYDSVPEGPGADDNASGVAGALAAAQILKGMAFKKTIRFWRL